MMVHSDERPFQCTECGTCFKKNSALNKHMVIIVKLLLSGTVLILLPTDHSSVHHRPVHTRASAASLGISHRPFDFFAASNAAAAWSE